MALAASTSAANQTLSLAAGSHAGHILVSHTGCTVQGAGMDSTTVELDGTYAEGVRPGATVASFRLRNLTIDCNALAGVTAPIEAGGGISTFIAENVRVKDHARGTIAIYNRAVFRGTNIEILGNGGGINHFTGATETTIDGCTITGGQYGFQNTAGDGISLTDITGRFDYWASPTYEAVTATAYNALYADVASHTEADRTLYDVLRYLSPVATFTVGSTFASSAVHPYDRVEVADGTWTQVLRFTGANTVVLDDWRSPNSWTPCAAPAGTATVYRVTLGRVLSWTATRLHFQSGNVPTSPRWRSVTGATMDTPTTGGGSRLDIIRVGGSNRDVDTGGIHITETARNASLNGCSIVGGWSDCITLRGVGTVADDCFADLGQDMGFTVDGTTGRVVVTNSHAQRAGRTGFACLGGPVKVWDCVANNNGTINDGSGDYGVSVTGGAVDGTYRVTGNDNLDGLIVGAANEEVPADDPFFLPVLHGRARGRRR